MSLEYEPSSEPLHISAARHVSAAQDVGCGGGGLCGGRHTMDCKPFVYTPTVGQGKALGCRSGMKCFLLLLHFRRVFILSHAHA